MRAMTLVSALALALATPALAQTAAPLTPAQAVAAAKAGEVAGSFEFTVASTGAVGFVVFLNSAANYRDEGNLTVVLEAPAINALRQKLGGYPEETMKGKRVRVKGTARRVPTGSHFQTRISVETADQIEILG